MSRQDRADLLQRIAPWMTDEAQVPVLEAVLDGVPGDALADFAVAIGNHTGFGIAAFDEPIANAARNAESLHGLRASVLLNFDSPSSDRFLLSTLDLSAADVAWLDGEAERARAVRLLRRLIDNASPRTLVSAQRDPTSRDRILGLLMEDVAGSAGQLVRVAGASDLAIGPLLDLGSAALPFLAPEERDKFVTELLGRAFTEADADDARVPSLLEDAGALLSPRQLVHMATPPAAPTQRVAANLVLLSHGSERVRQAAAAAIEDLCERLIHRFGKNLGEAGFRAWASLLDEAGKHFPDAQLRASLPTLPFALAKRDLPVSTLIAAAFPVVYSELLRSTGEEDFRRLPALLALPLSIFIDWDRAKSARHELVDAYLYSSWPPADLLLTSIAADIQVETLHRLVGTHRGRDYLATIDRDSHRLEPRLFAQIQNCLRLSRPRY
jgi:hypothetical protein